MSALTFEIRSQKGSNYGKNEVAAISIAGKNIQTPIPGPARSPARAPFQSAPGRWKGLFFLFFWRAWQPALQRAHREISLVKFQLKFSQMALTLPISHKKPSAEKVYFKMTYFRFLRSQPGPPCEARNSVKITVFPTSHFRDPGPRSHLGQRSLEKRWGRG